MFINYAHRGSSEYYPENTMVSFHSGVEMGANGIETDVRKTKDDVLVLFHDSNFERILKHTENSLKNISDFDYNELLTMDFGIFKGERFKGESIVTLKDFLTYFGKKDLTFAIELKDKNIEKEVLECIYKFDIVDKCIITSFDLETLIKTKKIDSSIRIGYLVESLGEKELEDCIKNEFYQVCIKASNINKDIIELAQKHLLSVRAWGVTTENEMKRIVDLKDVDGMTINFPDKLSNYLESL